MNWHLLWIKLLPIILGAVVIYVSYKLPASIIRSERKDKMKRATPWEVVWAFSRTIVCCLILAGVFSFNIENNKAVYFTVWLLVSAIPAIVGLWEYFEKDAKMKVADRIGQQIKLHREEQEATQHHSEW